MPNAWFIINKAVSNNVEMKANGRIVEGPIKQPFAKRNSS